MKNYLKDIRVQAAKKALEQSIGRTIEIEDLYKWKDSQTCEQYLGMPYLPVFDDPTHKKYFGNFSVT